MNKPIHPAIAEHVMGENERLRGLLREIAEGCTRRDMPSEQTVTKWADRIDAALSQQAEPTDTFTAADMATAAAQGFRDGQAAVEQAAAQDEQPAVFWVLFDATGPERFIKKDVSDGTLAFFDSEDEAQRAKRRHPGTDYKRVEYYRAPIAQTAPTVAARGGDTFWREKLAIKFCEARGILDGSTERARVVDAFVSALSFAAPQPEQSGWISVEGCEP